MTATVGGTAPRSVEKTWRGDDFPSWLSPMVVKELRQGVQSGAFAWTFVGLQGAMFFLMSWALTVFSPDGGFGRDTVHSFFWLIVAVGVLLVLPLRGLGAISSERVGNNLDLVRLTRLSATRIVTGKWLAIVAQCALLVAAILPYLVLRYFFGGVNVVRDLEIVGWLFAGSMVVTAAALALSTLPHWVRIAVSVLSGPFAFGALIGFMERGGVVTFGAAERLGILAVVALYTVALLEYAASRIAPVAENHASRKRGLALLIGVAWLIVGEWGGERTAGWTMAVTLPLVLAYAIEALLEEPVHLKSQAAVFTGLGLPGRVAARLLLPGWATGLLFAVVLAAMCLPAAWMFAERFTPAKDQPGLVVGLLLAATVLFPLPVVVYLSRVRYRLLLYALVQLLCFIVFIYTNAMKPPALSWESWRLGWEAMLPLPLASLCSLLASDGSEEVASSCLVASVTVAAAVLLAVAWPWLQEMRQTSQTLAAVRAARGTRAAPGNAGAEA